MGRYHQSNQTYVLPEPMGFKPPQTVEQFKELSYSQRLYFKMKFPADYERFRKESERQPGDWRYDG